MIDIKNFASQVKKNCNISDAHFWGSYSLCGLLLRLRELYRSEHSFGLWEKINQKDIGEWITEREKIWKEFEYRELEHITLNSNAYEPFDAEKINTELEQYGLIYGAGYGLHMKPVFFLADLVSKQKLDGFDIYITGHEYARDLSDHPAMVQDKAIIARVDTTKLLLWQRFEEFRCKRSKCALAFAFSKYGITPEEELSENTERKISEIARAETETYIYHELGELFEGQKIGEEWKAFLTDFPHSKAEIFARAVKDILSDTSEHGMLKYIIESRKEGSLGFYIVFLGGFRKIIFPEILNAFQMFTESGDWNLIDNVRKTGYKKAEEYAERLLSLNRGKADSASVAQSIENEIVNGLL
jgi:hypothetical protein